jgi:hypothetical protein
MPWTSWCRRIITTFVRRFERFVVMAGRVSDVMRDSEMKEEFNKYLSDLIFRDREGAGSFEVDSVQRTNEGLNVFVKPHGDDRYLKLVVGLLVVDVGPAK